jgi:hypothetical protein
MCIKYIKKLILLLKKKYKEFKYERNKKYDKINFPKIPSYVTTSQYPKYPSMKRFVIYDNDTGDFSSDEFNSSFSDSDLDLSY